MKTTTEKASPSTIGLYGRALHEWGTFAMPAAYAKAYG